MYDIYDRIDETPETELERIFCHIMHKVDAFAVLLDLDRNTKDFLRKVIRYALTLYVLTEEKHGSLREHNFEDCYAAMDKIHSANLNKVEHSLYLARDIAQEYVIATSIKIR